MTITKSSDFLALWFNRLIALLIVINYLLVLFNLTYLPFRDFWLEGKVQLSFKTPIFSIILPRQPLVILPENMRSFILQYDWVKGIETYRETEEYLTRVAELNQAIEQQKESNKIKVILKDLQDMSVAMIENNPFIVSGQSGKLEIIKNRMRSHVFQTKNSSAKEAFRQFWTWEYLNSDLATNLNFFNQRIKPLLDANFFRAIGENGLPEDEFILLDFPFTSIFLLDFLTRTFLIGRRYKTVTWFDAMLWRWYDIFLFLPFWRWLRIIPLLLRLDQAKIISLQSIHHQISRGLVATIAEDITEVILIQIINQIQELISQGGIRDIVYRGTKHQYIDLNEINEILTIIKLVAQVAINRVLPQLAPDIETILKYNIHSSLSQSSALMRLQNLPAVKNLVNQLSENISKQIYQLLQDFLEGIIKDDPNFNKLLDQLIFKLRQTLSVELKSETSMDMLESLLVDLLEEIKINYIRRLSEEDVEAILEQTRALRHRTQ